MKTLTVEDFNPNKKSNLPVSDDHKSHAQIYKHGLEFTIAGNYMDLMHFSEALKGLSNKLFWQKAVLQAKEYPVSDFTITVYTLSLDKSWLSI
jgi:MSHA biogenesis protein MshJ